MLRQTVPGESKRRFGRASCSLDCCRRSRPRCRRLEPMSAQSPKRLLQLRARVEPQPYASSREASGRRDLIWCLNMEKLRKATMLIPFSPMGCQESSLRTMWYETQTWRVDVKLTPNLLQIGVQFLEAGAKTAARMDRTSSEFRRSLIRGPAPERVGGVCGCRGQQLRNQQDEGPEGEPSCRSPWQGGRPLEHRVGV